ncbi:MAG TPA: hypothetical protein VFS10_12150 [Pyrinomonadaceae bacterium]|nr:hypothetical protein [Pyrinomonadaceae bacterium]
MKRFVFPRELLLVEIERRCVDPACGARSRPGLTKAEARAYTGFECEACGLWCEDSLAERDVPEWWEELKVTGLEGVRLLEAPGAEGAEPGEVVARMSEAWQRLGEAQEGGAEFDEEGEGEPS